MLNQFDYIKIEPKSFAAHTFELRYPSIIQRIMDSSLFDQKTVTKLKGVKNELADLKIERLHQPVIDKYWDWFYQSYLHMRLVDIPFFYAEVYFFALIRAVVRYDEIEVDPFGKIKLKDIEQNYGVLVSTLDKSKDWSTRDFVLFALQGNKSDLSQLKNGAGIELDILIDHVDVLSEYLRKHTCTHIIQDNSGVELFSDLLLAHHLIDCYGHTVYLHLKSEPIFVSDSLIDDIDVLLDKLASSSFSIQIKKKIQQGSLMIKTSTYWSSPTHFKNIEEEIAIQTDSMIISKGDANYRRFFADKQLEASMDASQFTEYLRCPVFCIRTLKSDIQTNISERTVRELDDKNSAWMHDGSCAVIQCIHS